MSMKNLFTPLLLLFSLLANSQTTSWITNLDNAVNETSGLILLNHRLITHNDSGGEPALYEIDTASGQVLRKVIVQNATNVDWEDIAIDPSYIYIGDFGNNLGDRTDLKIYRVLISDYLNASNDSILADIINFSYSNQSNFTSANMATNFDAEALVSISDSLYIFTKNWKNSWTNVYGLSNQPGTYSIHKKDSLDVKGFITGATFNPHTQDFTLLGYNFLLSPFAVKVTGFSNGSFANATLQKHQLPFSSSHSGQTEGICFINNDQYFVSAEESQGKSTALFLVNLSDDMSISDFTDKENLLYPNPVSGILNLKNTNITLSEIYNESGILLLKSEKQEIDVSGLGSGTYMLITLATDGKTDTNKIVIK